MNYGELEIENLKTKNAKKLRRVSLDVAVNLKSPK